MSLTFSKAKEMIKEVSNQPDTKSSNIFEMCEKLSRFSKATGLFFSEDIEESFCNCKNINFTVHEVLFIYYTYLWLLRLDEIDDKNKQTGIFLQKMYRNDQDYRFNSTILCWCINELKRNIVGFETIFYEFLDTIKEEFREKYKDVYQVIKLLE